MTYYRCNLSFLIKIKRRFKDHPDHLKFVIPSHWALIPRWAMSPPPKRVPMGVKSPQKSEKPEKVKNRFAQRI